MFFKDIFGRQTGLLRTKWISTAIIGAAAMALAGWSGAAQAQTPPAAKTHVKEAIPTKSASFWANYVAVTMGFYAAEGIDLEFSVIDPNITISSIIGKGVDIAYADSSNLMYAIEKGADLIAVGMSTERQPYRLMAGPTIKTIADLKGKKIGSTSEVDVYTYVIKEIVRKGGLNPDKDVEFVFGGNQTRRVAALVGGAIDAGLFSPPQDSRLKGQGYNGLAFTPDYYPLLTLSAETVTREWLDQNHDVLRRLLRAEQKAVDWLNDPANKAKALEILMKEVGSNLPDSEEAYNYYIGQHVWKEACIHE